MKKIVLSAAVVSVLSFASCTVNGVGELKFKDESSESFTVSEKKINALDIKLNVGDCTVKYGDVKTPEINAKYKFRGITKEKLDEAKENIALSTEVNDGVLTVRIVDKRDSEDFISKLKKGTEAETDITVTLPEKDYDFTIESNVGDIVILDAEGSFNITQNVGSVELNDISVTDDCDISSDVGDVKVEFEKVDKSHFDIRTNVGDITVDAGKMSVKTISESDQKVGDKKTVEIDGKCKLKMESDVGDISIR